MMKTAIIGASGYSGEELVRLLSRHPQVELALVSSRSLVGKPLVDVMPKFRGLVSPELKFTDSDPEALAARADIDVFFLALPHGVAAEFAVPLVKAGRKVIDLSADFRLGTPERYEEFYGQPHPAPDLLKEAVYVIPEITPAGWESAQIGRAHV